MQIIKKEKDREVSFLIEGVNPALYRMVFNPDYFESLGLKQVYNSSGGGGGGGGEEPAYPYKYFHILYDWMFSSKPAPAAAPVPEPTQFQYPENRTSLESIMQSSKPPKLEMRPYDLREAAEPAPEPAPSPEPEPAPAKVRPPETIMQELTESHPYVLQEAAPAPKETTLLEQQPVPAPEETTLLEQPPVPAPAPASTIVFTFHKIGLVHGYGEYNELKKRQTTDADIEHDADGKTKQEILGEMRDADVQAYYKSPLLKMGEKAEVQEAKRAELAFTGEKVFMIRTFGGKTIMLDWRLFPQEKAGFFT